MRRRNKIAQGIRNAMGEQEMNPATNNPIMTMDDYLNVQTSMRQNGATERSGGEFVFESSGDREKALAEAESFFPSLDYSLKDEGGKFTLVLLG